MSSHQQQGSRPRSEEGGSKERTKCVDPCLLSFLPSAPSVQRLMASWYSNSVLDSYPNPFSYPGWGWGGGSCWRRGCCHGKPWVASWGYSVEPKGKSAEAPHHSWQKDTQTLQIKEPSFSQQICIDGHGAQVRRPDKHGRKGKMECMALMSSLSNKREQPVNRWMNAIEKLILVLYRKRPVDMGVRAGGSVLYKMTFHLDLRKWEACRTPSGKRESGI